MRPEKRTGLITLLWLTVYVGAAPFVSIAAVMFLARSLGAIDQGWGWIFALGYLGAVWLGAQAYVRHFERR